jgi:endonuclease/exonuclease/phosphatase family metal-dependent hydrolase
MSFFPKQPSSRTGVTQTIAFDGSVAIANVFGPETFQLRLAADSACCYRIGDGAQTATTADIFLPANTIDHVIVSPGQSISAIKAVTNGLVTATAGTLWVTEMS